jgi:hypothetical protein
LFISNLFTFFISGKRSYEERYNPGWLFLDTYNFDHDKVYINTTDVKEMPAYYRSFIDQDIDFTKYSRFYAFDQRFTYRVTDNISDAGYFLCSRCSDFMNYTFIKSGSLRGEAQVSLYRR